MRGPATELYEPRSKLLARKPDAAARPSSHIFKAIELLRPRTRVEPPFLERLLSRRLMPANAFQPAFFPVAAFGFSGFARSCAF